MSFRPYSIGIREGNVGLRFAGKEREQAKQERSGFFHFHQDLTGEL
jgi:hypothetical protein